MDSALATVTGASVTPTQRQLVATGINTFSASWRVTTDAFHRAGTTSSGATLIDAANGRVLGSAGMSFSAAGGGPFTFNETISISAAQVGNWQSQGITRVVLQRVFEDPGSSATATAAMALLVPASGQLSGARVSPAQSQLVASQNNVFTASWQVAEPGSTESEPLYRTLALVRRNITGSQRSILNSPVLPTARTGKYLVRFCVTNRDMIMEELEVIGQCPIQDLIIDAAYQVQGKAASTAVYQFAMKTLYNEADAAEVLNEVMMEVWRRAQTFSGNSRVKTWLLSITHHKAVDMIRRKSRRDGEREFEETTEVSLQCSLEQGSLEQARAGVENSRHVRHCMDELKGGHRQVVYLTFYQGQAYSDIAEILQIPAGTVKTRMMHAKKQLMQCLSKLTETGPPQEELSV